MQPLDNGLRIIANMICYNEIDIIAETIESLAVWGVPRLVVLDGGSDDGTWELLQAIANRQTDIDIELDLHREGEVTDFRELKRETLYELTRRHAPFDWVLSVDADEIYHTSPIEAIEIAENDNASCIFPFIPEFWVTLDDIRNGALIERPSVPYQERRRWYTWCWRENHAWRERPDLHYYPGDVHRDPTCEAGINWINQQSPTLLLNHLPIQKHYSARSVYQGVIKAVDRLQRGKRYFGKMAESWIVDEKIGLHYFDGEWNMNYNQQIIKRWFESAREAAKLKGWV